LTCDDAGCSNLSGSVHRNRNVELQGQVVPPRTGEVELQQLNSSIVTMPIDEVGWFRFDPRSVEMFRLALWTADGVSIVTAWTTL
jgi:hypothetical protein